MYYALHREKYIVRNYLKKEGHFNASNHFSRRDGASFKRTHPEQYEMHGKGERSYPDRPYAPSD